MMSFLVGPFLTWLPIIFFWAVFISAASLYIFRNHRMILGRINLPRIYKFLAISVIAFNFVYALLLSFGQYMTWAYGGKFTELFLNSPLDPSVPPLLITNLFPTLFESPLGYFFFYSWGRFWINPLIAVGLAVGFWTFLRALKKYKDRFFEAGETEFGLVCILIAGWPGFVVFLPLVFISMILLSIFRMLYAREAYTTLGYPFLIGAFLTLIFGDYFITIFNLTVLRI